MTALALLCASAVPVLAARHRSVRVVKVATPAALSVSLTPVADGAPLHSDGTAGAIDLGAVSYVAARRDGNVAIEQQSDRYTVATKFGLTINDPSSHVTTASVTAYVVYPSRYVVRVDGVKIDPTPRLLFAHVPVGRISVHRLEVEIPNNVPADAETIINHPIQFAAIAE